MHPTGSGVAAPSPRKRWNSASRPAINFAASPGAGARMVTVPSVLSRIDAIHRLTVGRSGGSGLGECGVRVPDVRYCQAAGGVTVAYQVFGEGPDLLFHHGWVSNVEEQWEIPEYALFLRRLSAFARVVMFDKR